MVMARSGCTFRQRDVAAALRAARDAGVEVARFEIGKDGRIVVIVGKPNDAATSQRTGEYEWDEG
jgi:hypothetical protein